MPVEIIHGPTKPDVGEIKKNDLAKMKNDFINESDLKPYNGRVRLIKKFSVSVMKEEIKGLIEHYEKDPKGIELVTLNFAVQINPFIACNGIDYADSLTVVIEAAKFVYEGGTKIGHASHIDIGDFVIIPGYNSSNKIAGSQPCCPSSNP